MFRSDVGTEEVLLDTKQGMYFTDLLTLRLHLFLREGFLSPSRVSPE